jgi:hypothetical protein
MSIASAADIYLWHVKLARVKNSFCLLSSTTESAWSRINALGAIDTALVRWRDEIPLEYRPDQEILASAEAYRFIAMLHLQYFDVLRAIHWTSVISARQAGVTLDSHLNPRIRASQAICVNSARSFVKILNE